MFVELATSRLLTLRTRYQRHTIANDFLALTSTNSFFFHRVCADFCVSVFMFIMSVLWGREKFVA